MSIEDVLKKIAGIEGIDVKDIDELKALVEEGKKPKDEKALKDQKAATSRILEEKKKLAEKLAEQEAEIETLKTGGLTEIEKTKKEMEKLVKAREKLEAELNEAKTKSAQVERNYQLEKISGKIKFLEVIPSDMRSYAINTAFKDIQDLTQDAEVDKVLGTFKETHKGILASDTEVRGSGSNGSNMQSSSNKSPEDQTPQERAKVIKAKVRENSLR